MKRSVLIGLCMGLPASGAVAQVPLDRADPNVIGRTVPGNRAAPATDVPLAPLPATPAPVTVAGPVTGIVRAITVTGQDQVPPSAFAAVIAEHVGRTLDRADLSRLAGAVAEVARTRGFPFATAAVEPQPLADGILRVTLDLGRIDAVRVIGARNAAADRILTRALATGSAVRRAELERAILLVGDLPGVRVTGSRFVRQDGFGILLVTIEEDRASLYVQLDNRGSDEVGPFRSTLVASLRDLAGPADELAVIASQTPFQVSEFAFLRVRYGSLMDSMGTTMSVSASVARSRPGGDLAYLRVLGRSADAAVAVQRPLLRRQGRSLTAGVEFRALGTDQTISGRPLRRDRLTTLAATLDGTAALAGGVLRGGVAVTAGLPLDGTTREGSLLSSRLDGDARFVTASYALDWSAPLWRPLSIALASAGQVASRPLLASAEIGLGGPTFGRGYDFSERTGDEGALGSFELRADAGRIPGSLVTRAQFYGFVDGGYVHNLRDGAGGGTLVSAGGGARLGTGRFDWLAELALPVNADRFDTGDRHPRVTLRVARAF